MNFMIERNLLIYLILHFLKNKVFGRYIKYFEDLFDYLNVFKIMFTLPSLLLLLSLISYIKFFHKTNSIKFIMNYLKFNEYYWCTMMVISYVFFNFHNYSYKFKNSHKYQMPTNLNLKDPKGCSNRYKNLYFP